MINNVVLTGMIVELPKTREKQKDGITYEIVAEHVSFMRI